MYYLAETPQMGSSMKKSIFDEQTSKALKKWHMAAKKHGGKSPRSTNPSSPMGSPLHPAASSSLHRFKTTGHSTRHEDIHDLEDPSTPPAVTASLIRRSEPNDFEHDVHVDISPDEERNEDDFSFAKPAPGKGSSN